MPRLVSVKAQAFALDIDRGVAVPIMGNAAGRARPGPVPKGQFLLDVAAVRAELTAGKVAIDFDQALAGFAAVVLQDGDKVRKAQIRYFPAPEDFHPAQAQIFDTEYIESLCQLPGQLVMKVPSAVGNAPMQPGQSLLGSFAAVAAFLLSGKVATGLPQPLQISFQRLRHLDCGPVRTGEKLLESEIKARGSTRRGFDRSGFFRFNGKYDPEITHGIAGYGHGLDLALDIAAVVKAVDASTNLHPAGREQFPSGLFQGEGAIARYLLERRRMHFPP